jgi:hypothetical protein
MDGGARRISSDITVDQCAEQNYYALVLAMNFNSILGKAIYSGDCLQHGARLHELGEPGFVQAVMAQADVEFSTQALCIGSSRNW